MKNVLISVLVVGLLAAAVAAALSISEFTKQAATPIAGSLIAAIPAVHQLLQKSGSRLSLSARKRGVVSLHGYAMPVVMLALYGILIMLSVPFLVFFVMGFAEGFAAGFAGVALEKGPKIDDSIIRPLVTIAQLIMAYFVGRWIGVRSESKGLFAILAIAFFAPFIDLVPGLFHGGPGQIGIGEFLFMLLVGVVKIGVPAVFGYWRGRVIQSSRYLTYLLRALPQESRDALVNLASDEAKRLASSGASQLGTSPA